MNNKNTHNKDNKKNSEEVINTSNLNEVHILPKEVTKPGYFERLFNIFS